MSWDIPPEVRNEAPSALGSFIALLFVRANPWRKVAYFIAGWGLSKIFGESVQGITGTTLDAARALAALFSLAIIEKVFDMLAAFDHRKAIGDVWEAIVNRFKR